MTNTNEQKVRMPDDQLVIKGRVSMARIMYGLQKQEVAKMLSDNGFPISNPYYGQKETDPEQKIKKDMLVVLAKIYDLPVETFLYGQLGRPKDAPKFDELNDTLDDVIEVSKVVPYELIEEPTEVSEHRREVKNELDNDLQTVVNIKSYFETVISRMQNNINELKGGD